MVNIQGKEKLSVFLSTTTVEIIDEIAKLNFNGSRSIALENIFRNFNREKFYRQQAKYHQRELQHFAELMQIEATQERVL